MASLYQNTTSSCATMTRSGPSFDFFLPFATGSGTFQPTIVSGKLKRSQKFIHAEMTTLPRFDIVAAVPTLYIAPSWRMKCQKPDGQADMPLPEDLDGNPRHPAPWPVYSPGSATARNPGGIKPFQMSPSTEVGGQLVPEAAPTRVGKREGGRFRRIHAIGVWLCSYASSCWKGVLHAVNVVWGTVLAIDLMIRVTRSINRLCKVDDDGRPPDAKAT